MIGAGVRALRGIFAMLRWSSVAFGYVKKTDEEADTNRIRLRVEQVGPGNKKSADIIQRNRNKL